MVNVKGAPKRHEDAEWAYTSIFIPKEFRPHWKVFCQLADSDQDQNFLDYCTQVERLNMEKRGRGRRGLYLRWLITSHVLDNQHKLRGNK